MAKIKRKKKRPKAAGFLPDATNFKDIPIKDKRAFEKDYGKASKCPLCRGHGGWNLTLDAYGPGQHFQASCSQCSGWGWVEKGSKDAMCIHTDKELSRRECRERGIDHFGVCYHVVECVECGRISTYDSSG